MRAAIVWFRNDLRLDDHPALAVAAGAAQTIVPAYVHAPEEHGGWPPGAASRWWLHHSLTALDRSLRAAGAPLRVLRGPSAAALIGLARESGAAAVYWNRSYEPALAARDAALERTLAAAGLESRSFQGNVLFEPGSVLNRAGEPFRVFTAFYRACREQLDAVGPPLAAPARAAPAAPPIGDQAIDGLGLLPRVRWDAGLAARFEPGEAGAHVRLAGFLEASAADYAVARDRPDLPGSSRLSPYLHFGELSPRQVLAAARVGLDAPGNVARREGIESFLRELLWREFAQHLLHHFPDTPDSPLDPRFRTYPWREDPAALVAWQRGRTGIPLVDAGMRELWHTGWMHNRVRMVVASFLTKNLGLDWREGARWFFDTLVDADLANNTLGWQWVAGCGADAAPYYRILNPVLQAERFDPARAYLRTWLPELVRLPEPWLAAPFAAPGSALAAGGITLGADYPAPLVDLKLSREQALARFAATRGARS